MGGHPIRNVLRIDNVETQPAEPITANDEERQHQGFDIQTVFAWPLRDGVLDVASALASDADGPILYIDYASGATISRLNKGLRRRKEKSIFGFGIDPATGRPEEGDEDPTPEGPVRQRVVPIEMNDTMGPGRVKPNAVGSRPQNHDVKSIKCFLEALAASLQPLPRQVTGQSGAQGALCSPFLEAYPMLTW